jgi:hypothetical protein
MALTLQGLANRFDPTNTRELRTSFDIDALGTSDTMIRQVDPQVEQAN